MLAAVLHGKEDVRIQELPDHPLAPGEVRVRIGAALTCGTDLKVFKRGHHARMLTPPCAFGHEFAGVVSEVHPATTGWVVGERVAAANSAPCGECPACRRGQENLCDDLLFLNGAYAESIVIPARLATRNLLRLRPETAFRDAALTEPLACVVQGLEDLRPAAGERLLVIGAGPIGLMALALTKHAGCEVAVAGRGAQRLALGQKLGAVATVDMTGSDDVEAAVKAGLKDTRFDAVFEAVGRPETWTAAVRLVRPGGRVNLFGGCPAGATVTFDAGLLHYSSLTLLASFHHTPRTIRHALHLVESGVIRAADFVTGEAALRELPELFRAMAAGNRAVKTLVTVSR